MDRGSEAHDKEAYSCYNQAGFISVSFHAVMDGSSSRAYCMEKVGKQKAVRGADCIPDTPFFCGNAA